MISTIQWIIIVFAAFALSRAYLRYRDEKITGRELLFWSLIWVGGIFIVLNQGVAIYMADLFGIGRGADLIIYISIVLLFYLVFRIYVKIETIEQDITKVVREVGIEKAKRKKR